MNYIALHQYGSFEQAVNGTISSLINFYGNELTLSNLSSVETETDLKNFHSWVILLQIQP